MSDGVIARDFTSGKKMLTLGGWSVLYIDHDLGEDKTGYDLINWALVPLNNKDWLPDEVVIVSSNPVGIANIARALEKSGFKKLGMTFTR